MRKLFLVLSGATWGEIVMIGLSLGALLALLNIALSAPAVTIFHVLVLSHAASLVYWVYRASALRQNLSSKNY